MAVQVEADRMKEPAAGLDQSPCCLANQLSEELSIRSSGSLSLKGLERAIFRKVGSNK